MNPTMEKPEQQHIEIARTDSLPTKGPNDHHGAPGGVYGTEAQQRDPKWEKSTVRRIDRRLLIICMSALALCPLPASAEAQPLRAHVCILQS